MHDILQQAKTNTHALACGEHAFELFNGFYCAEAVLTALATAENAPQEYIPRIATGFCSGLARTAGLCGAMSGAVLGIGLVHGRDIAEESVEPAYSRTELFMAVLQHQYGSTNCKVLPTCDLGNAADAARFQSEGIKNSLCRPLARDCAMLACHLNQMSQKEVRAALQQAPRS